MKQTTPKTKTPRKTRDLLRKFPKLEAEPEDSHLNDTVCPKCGSRDDLHVFGEAEFSVERDGTADVGDHIYGPSSRARCMNCDFEGLFEECYFKGLDEALEAKKEGAQ